MMFDVGYEDLQQELVGEVTFGSLSVQYSPKGETELHRISKIAHRTKNVFTCHEIWTCLRSAAVFYYSCST
jgi:hypothetical protein